MIKTRKILRVAKAIIAMCMILNYTIISAQSSAVDYPVAGQALPYFKLANVDYYSKKTFEREDAKGKWLILDFWSLGCVSCVQAFPKMNKLQREFKDNVQIVMVAPNDSKYHKNSKQYFDRYTKNLKLNLTAAYDTVLFKRFRVQSTPHVIIVDPHGIVYAITFGSDLNSESLKQLIENEKPVIVQKDVNQMDWKYLVGIKNENAKQDFLFQSILSKSNGEAFVSADWIDQDSVKGAFQVTLKSLVQLYKYAWLGWGDWVNFDPRYETHGDFPVFEVRDSANFVFIGSGVSVREGFKGHYNYSLLLPKELASRKRFMKIMQTDLENAFGYTATVETRQVPCWNLRATDKAKKNLVSANLKFEGELRPDGMNAKGITVKSLVSSIKGYKNDPTPVFDETGISGRIDIGFTAAMIDILDVKKALEKHGLMLEKSSRPMKVLVIRDIH